VFSVNKFQSVLLGFTLLGVNLLLSPQVSGETLDEEMSATIRTEYFIIHYDPKFKADAVKEKKFLEDGRGALESEFLSFPVDQLLKVDCDVYLHPKPTDSISEATARILSGDKDGVYTARIDVLTPSVYDSTYRTKVGEAMSDDPAFRLIVHEYCTILLHQIALHKKAGVTFFQCPSWFVQGYEEYCGLMLSSEHNRTEVLKMYLSMFKKNPDRVNFDFGLSVENEYIDGAMLLLFMNETFGKNKVQSVLSSPEPTFGKAIVESLGVDLPEFAERWHEWLKKKLG
jgi:hypothetical protein